MPRRASSTPDARRRHPIGSANGAAEPNRVSIGIGDGAFPLPIVLVLWAVDLQPRLPPLLGHPVGLLTMEVQGAVTSSFVAFCMCKVDREVAGSVRKRIRRIVERHVESSLLEPRDRARYVADLENWLEPRDHPRPGHQLQLAVSLSIQSREAVMADRQVRMRSQPDPPVHRGRAARTDGSHTGQCRWSPRLSTRPQTRPPRTVPRDQSTGMRIHRGFRPGKTEER